MNDVPLRDYFEERIRALEKATVVARDAMEKRLDGMNELRAAMKDQAQTYISRAEHEQLHHGITEDIRSLRESRAEIAGKAAQWQVALAWLGSAIAIVLGIINLAKELTP